MNAYDNFLVPRLPVLSTSFILAKEQFLTVITFRHVLRLYDLLKEAAVLYLGITLRMVPRNECTHYYLCIVFDKRSDIHESFTRHLNDKHKKQMIITRIQHKFDFA